MLQGPQWQTHAKFATQATTVRVLTLLRPPARLATSAQVALVSRLSSLALQGPRALPAPLSCLTARLALLVLSVLQALALNVLVHRDPRVMTCSLIDTVICAIQANTLQVAHVRLVQLITTVHQVSFTL